MDKEIVNKHRMWEKPIMIHGYQLQQTSIACPESYDVYAEGKQVAYFRLRHGVFRVDVPDCGEDAVYTSTPKGDGVFEQDERVRELTNGILAVQEYYINRKWDNLQDEF